MTYESVRKYFTPEGEKNPSAVRKLAAGAVSGAVAQTCTYPLYAVAHVSRPSQMLISCTVTSSAEDSRSTPCPDWDTGINQYGMPLPSLSPKRASAGFTRALFPIFLRLLPAWLAAG